MPEGVLLLDSDDRIVRANRAAEDLLGRPVRGLIGQRLADALGDEPELTRLLGADEEQYSVLERNGRDSRTYCAAHLVPLTDDRGRVTGKLITLRDFTRRKLAEETLQESERRFRELADALPLTVFETDARGALVFVNRAGREQFGYSPETLEHGFNFLRFVAGQDREAARHDLEAVLTGTPMDTREYLATRSDRTVFPAVISARAIYHDEVAVGATSKALFRVAAGIRGFIVDLSARKQAEVDQRRLLDEVQQRASELDAVFGAIPVALVIFDASGNVVQANTHARRILGTVLARGPRSLAERLGTLGMETPAGTPVPVKESPPLRALAGETSRDVVCVIHPSGEPICTSMSAAPIRGTDGQISGAFVTFADVTELLELQQQREDIARAVSHDLRTPLTVILGHGQVLQLSMASGANERWKDSVDSIVLAAQQMNSMIRDLVDSLRMESGQLELDRTAVDLPSMASGLKGRLAGALETERVRVVIPENLPLVLADRDRLERILTNLISNALKYSDPATEVVVSFHQADGEVVTTVTDHGYGMPEEVLARLFQRYSRPAAAGGRKRDSIGLGLYISRGLVEAHGGRIWADSRVGKGSKFSFTMPVSPEQ
jgi:PAS domain S-box-containing protein